MKLLVSGFGQFDHFSENPTGDLAKMVNGKIIHQVHVYGIKLDVSWKESWPAFQKTVRVIRPNALLAFGLAEESMIRLETLARNICGGSADYYNQLAPAGEIIKNGPDEYHTGLPVHWLLDGLKEWGYYPNIPARFSEDAGDYLCNYLFYRMMHRFRKEVPLCGFVHMPAYPADGLSTSFSKNDVQKHGLHIVRLLTKFMQNSFRGNV